MKGYWETQKVIEMMRKCGCQKEHKSALQSICVCVCVFSSDLQKPCSIRLQWPTPLSPVKRIYLVPMDLKNYLLKVLSFLQGNFLRHSKSKSVHRFLAEKETFLCRTSATTGTWLRQIHCHVIQLFFASFSPPPTPQGVWKEGDEAHRYLREEGKVACGKKELKWQAWNKESSTGEKCCWWHRKPQHLRTWCTLSRVFNSPSELPPTLLLHLNQLPSIRPFFYSSFWNLLL